MPNQYRKGTTTITLRVPALLKERVQQVAKARHTTVNGLVRDVLSTMVTTVPSTAVQDDPGPDPSDFSPYLRRIEAAVKEHRAAMADRRRRAMDFAAKIAEMLSLRFGATKVTLVGSMSRPQEFIGSASDIDLLVTGLRNEDYVSATTAAERLTNGEFTVDLIRMEDLTEAALDLFFREGMSLQ